MPRKDLILAIDQGTTGTTVLLVDSSLRVLAKENREFAQYYPQPGWVEHDPEEIWQSVTDTLVSVVKKSGIDPARIAGIGITNQRETTLLWDRKTGKALHRAIVWQCRRTAPRCAELATSGKDALFFKKTGLVLDAYFSGTKLEWLLNAVPGAKQRAEAGELAFGTVDSFLVSRLTRGAVHVTDISNASRTLLMDLKTGAWDPELLSILHIPRAVLPEIRGNAEIYGKTRDIPGLPDGIPIAGMAGDQQAALFGQACFDAGEAKCTYGTGAFVLLNIGETPRLSQHRLLTTVAWRLNGKTTYAFEGSAFIAGAAVQWLRDGLGIIGKASEIEALASSVPDNGGLAFVPALAGLGAPYWDPHARGTITGLTRGSTRAHLARATLEGIAHEVDDLLVAMASDLESPLRGLRVDGGAAANNLLMQTQADLAGISVVRPRMIETTALGAAALAGLGVGLWQSTDEIRAAWQEDRRFAPAIDRKTADSRRAFWKSAVARAKG